MPIPMDALRSGVLPRQTFSYRFTKFTSVRSVVKVGLRETAPIP